MVDQQDGDPVAKVLELQESVTLELLSALAVDLREEDVRNRLTDTRLPEILVAALDHQDVAILEQVGRVAANLSVYHERNLDRLLQAGYPTAVVAVLQRPLPFDTVRPLVASLLNAVMSQHEPTMMALAAETERLIRTIEILQGGAASVVSWLSTILAEVAETSVKEGESLEIGSGSIAILAGSFRPFMGGEAGDGPDEIKILCETCRFFETSCGDEPVAGIYMESLPLILDFIQDGVIPPSWSYDDDFTASSCEEDIGKAKAALIKMVVAMSENIQADWFWSRMQRWLGQRPDLQSCGLLCFGNKARDDANAVKLLDDLLPTLDAMLLPESPIIVQHALVGLLRNLSIPSGNKTALSAVTPKLVKMGVWDKERDMVGSVQGGAIGVVKNLCRENATNSIAFIADPAAVDQLCALIERTDDPAIRFEGTRVFVNIARSASAYKDTMNCLATPRIVGYLARMLYDGREYPVLLNEAIISLAIVVSFGPPGTAELVRTALKRGDAESPRQVLDGLATSELGSAEIRANAETLQKLLAN